MLLPRNAATLTSYISTKYQLLTFSVLYKHFVPVLIGGEREAKGNKRRKLEGGSEEPRGGSVK